MLQWTLVWPHCPFKTLLYSWPGLSEDSSGGPVSWCHGQRGGALWGRDKICDIYAQWSGLLHSMHEIVGSNPVVMHILKKCFVRVCTSTYKNTLLSFKYMKEHNSISGPIWWKGITWVYTSMLLSILIYFIIYLDAPSASKYLPVYIGTQYWFTLQMH